MGAPLMEPLAALERLSPANVALRNAQRTHHPVILVVRYMATPRTSRFSTQNLWCLADHKWPHHVVLLVLQDMAMPDVLLSASPRAYGVAHSFRR